MSAVQQFLLTYGNNKDKARGIAQDMAKGRLGALNNHSLISLIVLALETKQITLIEVVQSLGEYINDEDPTNRAKAIEYLSQIIGELPPNFLSRQQIQVLCQFLCDRIEDEGAVGGLRKLEEMGRYNHEMATLTFRA